MSVLYILVIWEVNNYIILNDAGSLERGFLELERAVLSKRLRIDDVLAALTIEDSAMHSGGSERDA